MATESNPVEQDPTTIEAAKPPPVGNELPVKPTVAADFVSADTDRPKASESTLAVPPGTAEPPSSGKGGRPRSDNPSKEALRSRRRYAEAKAARAGTLPPSFGDLPGGSKAAEPGAAMPPPPVPGAPPVNYKANAEACFQLVTGMLVMVSGDQWAASSGERDMMVDSLARYMEYKQWKDLSPGWSLAIIGTMYVVPRLTHEKTKEQLKKLVGKFSGERKEPNARNDVEIT